jgi:hypothetical protein
MHLDAPQTKNVSSWRLSESVIPYLALIFSTLVFLSTFIAGGSDVWPYAPRVYVLPIAAAAGVALLIKLDLFEAAFLQLHKLILTYLIFVIFQSICHHRAGMEMSNIIRKISSTHVLAFMGFVTMLPLASVTKYRNWTVAVGASFIGVSLSFAMAQWLKFDIAWQVAAAINKNFFELWSGTSPGFAMNSVSLGFQFLFITPVGIYFAISAGRRYATLRWLCAIGFPLFLLPIQSRSVSITFMLVASTILFLASRPSALFFIDRLRTLAFLFVGCLSILATTTTLGAVALHENFAPHSVNQTINCQVIDVDCDAKSIERNSASIRLMAMMAVIDSIETPADFLLGPSMERYREKIPPQFDEAVFPHNLFFNALLISGAIGLLLVCSAYWMILGIVHPIKLYLDDRILFLGALTMLAQISNSMFHNDSLNHGSIYPWFVSAFIAGLVLEGGFKSVEYERIAGRS